MKKNKKSKKAANALNLQVIEASELVIVSGAGGLGEAAAL